MPFRSLPPDPSEQIAIPPLFSNPSCIAKVLLLRRIVPLCAHTVLESTRVSTCYARRALQNEVHSQRMPPGYHSWPRRRVKTADVSTGHRSSRSHATPPPMRAISPPPCSSKYPYTASHSLSPLKNVRAESAQKRAANLSSIHNATIEEKW